MKHVAIIGTQGVPASYGGFESLVENIIGDNCSPDVQYTIFCSSKDLRPCITMYKNARLKYVPLHANGKQSILYDIVSMLRVIGRYDTILVLGISGCIFLPVLKGLNRKRLIVNIDGLEHRREKWGKWARLFLRLSESVAIRFADVIIADNKGIQDYVKDNYRKKAELIAYGGDHVTREVQMSRQQKILASYDLKEGDYAISICRIEPENNCHVSLDAFSRTDKKFVFVGNWKHSQYAQRLECTYGNRKNILLLDSIYDLDILYTLRSNAGWYIHGHSAGGTNPSLVEAMFFACPIFCYNVVYNRETTKNKAYYWKDAFELQKLVQKQDLNGGAMKRIAETNYTWKHIARLYEALY